MKKAWQIAWYDLRMRLGERDTLIFSLLMPILFTVIISVSMQSAFGDENDQRRTVAVVDLDGGILADKVIELVASSESIRPVETSEQELDDLLDFEEVYAGLVIPAGFTNSLMQGEASSAVLRYSNIAASQAVQHEVQAILNHVGAAVTAAHFAASEFELMTKDSDLDQSKIVESAFEQATSKLDPPPVKAMVTVATRLEKPDPWENFSVGAQSSPGMVVMFGMTTMLGVAIVLVQERRLGTFRRMLVAPISRATILAGKMGGTLLLGLLQTTILIVFAWLVFDIAWGNDPVALVAVVLSFSLAIVCIGIFFSTLVRTEDQAGNLMVAIAMAMAALGGAWWPLLITPKFMQTFGHFFPSAWAMDAFQDIIVRGASLSDVALHVSIMMAFALVFFILGIWRLKFE